MSGAQLLTLLDGVQVTANVALRRAQPGDFDALAVLQLEAFHAMVAAQFGSWNSEAAEAGLKRLLDHSLVVVRRSSASARPESVIGQLAVQDGSDAQSVFLSRIIIHAEERGRGLGAALLAALQRAARKTNAQRIELDVWKANSNARRFYARHNCTVDDTADMPAHKLRLLLPVGGNGDDECGQTASSTTTSTQAGGNE